MRILLVEDHPDSRRVMAVLLRSLGHEVVPAESVDEALAASREGTFDCAIVDLQLPDGSGLALFQRISETHSLTGVALTGSDGDETAAACRSAGFRHHLVKPVDFDRLKRLLSELKGEADQKAT